MLAERVHNVSTPFPFVSTLTGKRFSIPTRKVRRYFASGHKIKSWLLPVFCFVPGVGLEPTRPKGQEILSLSWLPITPPGLLYFYLYV